MYLYASVRGTIQFFISFKFLLGIIDATTLVSARMEHVHLQGYIVLQAQVGDTQFYM